MQELTLLGEKGRSSTWAYEDAPSNLLGGWSEPPVFMKGIDASAYNTITDWNLLRKGGWEFVILRAGLGQSTLDTTFEQKYQAAKAAGLYVGAYWFSYATTPQQALGEAEAFLRVLKGKSFEMPVYIDKEDESSFAPGKPDKRIVTEICQKFCSRMEAAGAYVGIYASTNWFYNFIDTAATAIYTRWLADYRQTYDRNIPRDIHQYGVNTGILGVSGLIDCNKCFRDIPQEILRAGKNRF